MLFLFACMCGEEGRAGREWKLERKKERKRERGRKSERGSEEREREREREREYQTSSQGTHLLLQCSRKVSDDMIFPGN